MNTLDKKYINYLGYPQSGWIDLKSTSMTKADFLYHLTRSKAALENITLIPGETYFFFLQDIAKKLHISVYKLFDQYAIKAYKKDGNILANTYNVPIGMNEIELIDYLLTKTNQKYKKFSKKIFGFYDKEKWYKYVTIASIIQKEAASKQEMPLISSVIYNRLKKNMKLQMDGTLNYGKYSHTKITPKMIKENETSYNTYKKTGIPNDPICAVELEAIKAAIFPAVTNYLYFVKNTDGSKHIFSTTYKAHKKQIQKIKRYIKLHKKRTKQTKTIKPKITKRKTAKKKRKTPVYKRRKITQKRLKSLKSLWK